MEVVWRLPVLPQQAVLQLIMAVMVMVVVVVVVTVTVMVIIMAAIHGTGYMIDDR